MVTRSSGLGKSRGRSGSDRPRDNLLDSLLGHTGMHRPVQMHPAGAHLAAEHRVLRHGDFLLRHDLAVTVGNVLDHRFGGSQVRSTATTPAHLGTIRWNDGKGNGSH